MSRSIQIYDCRCEVARYDVESMVNGQIVTLGRSASVDLSFPSYDEVSRHHVSIRRAGDDFFIRNESYCNPVLINGEPMEHAVRMRSGVDYQIGRLSLALHGAGLLEPCEHINCDFIFPEPQGFANTEIVYISESEAPEEIALSPASLSLTADSDEKGIAPHAAESLATTKCAQANEQAKRVLLAAGCAQSVPPPQLRVSANLTYADKAKLRLARNKTYREARLLGRRKQQRKLMQLSCAVCILLMLICTGILLWFKIIIPSNNVATFSYVPVMAQEQTVEKVKPKDLSSKVAGGSPSPALDVVTVATASALNLHALDTSSIEIGISTVGTGLDGIGDGIGSGLGSGMGGADGAGLGSGSKMESAFVGEFWDLKREKDSSESVFYDPAASPMMLTFLSTFYNSSWDDARFKPYLKSPLKLYTTCFYMPNALDSEATHAYDPTGEYGLEKSRWVAVYRARVQAPKTGKFRFIGAGDSVMGVRFNKKNVLKVGLHNIESGEWGDIDPYDGKKETWYYKNCDFWNASINGFTAGDEFAVKKGRWYDMEVLVSEIGGGHFGFCLFIEDMADRNSEHRPTTPGWRFTKEIRERVARSGLDRQIADYSKTEQMELPLFQLFRTAMVTPDAKQLYETFKFTENLGTRERTYPAYDEDSLVWPARPM